MNEVMLGLCIDRQLEWGEFDASAAIVDVPKNAHDGLHWDS